MEKFQGKETQNRVGTTQPVDSVALECAVIDVHICTIISRNSSALEVACMSTAGNQSKV
jgi:hypothetical protein